MVLFHIRNKQKIKMMEATIAKAKSCPVDCNNVDKKFRQLAEMTEDEANFHMKQSAFLYKLAVQTMPKSLHCLSMRLTVEYFRSFDIEEELVEKFVNPDLYHYVIFSKNVLAASVAVNSTVAHAQVRFLSSSLSPLRICVLFSFSHTFFVALFDYRSISEGIVNLQESEKLVFHLLTDKENFFAMKLWFFRNKYADAAVQVLNIEDLKLYNHHKEAPVHLSLPEEFRVSFRRVDKLSVAQFRTQYISMFSEPYYLLPEIFQSLEKVVILGDDVIVQRDLSALWNLDMGEKVNGALQLCEVKLSDLKSYLLSDKFDEKSCAWTSGVNIIDLSRWRMQNLTGRYQRYVHEVS